MAAAKYNIKIERGADWKRTFTWKNATTGVPFDLTGCTARMHIREDVDSAVILDTLTTENGRITLGGALGTLEIVFPNATSTAYVGWEAAIYQLEVVYPTGIVERKLSGTVVLSAEVTR